MWLVFQKVPPFEYRGGRPCHQHISLWRYLYVEIAASELYAAAARGASGGEGRYSHGARAGSAGHRLSASAFPHSHGYLAGSGDHREFYVCAVGPHGVRLQFAAYAVDVEAVERVEKHHSVGIADGSP